jgi:hypothetical protein
MIQKLNRSFKIFGKFILFGNLRRKNVVEMETTPLRINYYMTSVFPDKQTKDEILHNIQQSNY